MLCVTHSPETKYLSKAENKIIKNQEIKMKISKDFSQTVLKKKSNREEGCNSQWTYYSYKYLCTKHS